ncbi:hypothetical protein LPJ53_000021 [Coemansia erecta]|uniref:Uncharacterized protein n=1 Tax=Coemansia erecta TaxID=147472 RepID=A0A9W7Y9B6_9FUNG|nr:hypothetical protein LPJ53_000021 [Coemansia erecta]
MSLEQGTERIRVVLAPQDDGSCEPGPNRILSGHVVVPENRLGGVHSVEIHYRGVEVVGGTLDDFEDDSPLGLQPRKGVRALSKQYFDERLVLWQRPADSADDSATTEEQRLAFSIAFPSANYPTAVKSVCASAPSQSFEIAYHLTAWLLGDDGATALAKSTQPLGFVPQLERPPLSHHTPQAPVARTAFDERGRECLVTRVTLSQAEYLPGDQVVGGVHVECARSNRTVRKAECQLRQRVECRMRRTFSPAETAEIIAGGSRPNSASAASDESDVLWCRSIDIGAPRLLTLTANGVGLAAAAAAAAAVSHQQTDVAEKRESSASRATMSTKGGSNSSGGGSGSGNSNGSGSGGNKACSANFHLDLPADTHVVAGHFLLFSYELLVEVTVYSLTRGTQKVATRTPLSSVYCSGGPGTPTSTLGLTLGRQTATAAAAAAMYQRAAPGDGSVSATAACFPTTGSTGLLLDSRETAQIKGSRFSVGAFHGGSGAGAGADDECARFSTFNRAAAAPIYRIDSQGSSAAEHPAAGGLPNAVEQLRFRCDMSLAFVPKIFVPVEEEEKKEPEAAETSAAPRDSKIDCDEDAAQAGDAENADGPQAEASPRMSQVFDSVFAERGEEVDSADETDAAGDAADDDAPVSPPSGSSSEFDLARAVYAAAERVLKDKQWDRPASYYLASNPEGAAAVSDGSGDAAATGADGDQEPGTKTEVTVSPTSPAPGNAGLGDLDVESAINDLAPTRRAADDSRRSSLVGSAQVKDFIQGIDFFGDGAADRNAGPELTGMLSADPEKLAFNVSLTSELVAPGDQQAQPPTDPLAADSEADQSGNMDTLVGKDLAAAAPAHEDGEVDAENLRALKQSPQQSRIKSVLRRSMSMPGNSSKSGNSSEVYSPGSTARSAFETGSNSMLVAKQANKDAAGAALAGMSPRSVFSAVSSASRIGSASRVGVFKTIGNRFTSWFSKKQQ